MSEPKLTLPGITLPKRCKRLLARLSKVDSLRDVLEKKLTAAVRAAFPTRVYVVRRRDLETTRTVFYRVDVGLRGCGIYDRVFRYTVEACPCTRAGNPRGRMTRKWASWLDDPAFETTIVREITENKET